MYPMLAGVPSITPSARSTSAEPAVRAGRTTTSTPSSSSVPAPLATASNISCNAGDGVWCTISSIGMMAELRPWPSHPSEAAMTLIVVSGAPGTGKSTVAGVLATEFGLPLLSLDEIKEALADVLGTGGEDWSNQVGDAAAEIVFRLWASFPGAVARGWWGRGR